MNSERENKLWWAVVEGGVKHVTGYSCAPHNPDVWWCPEVGCSLSEKYHLFETEKDALKRAICEADQEVETWTGVSEKLKDRLQGLHK